MESELCLQWAGCSPALVQLKQQLNRLSGVDFPLIIKGEKGTGKGLVASAIHRLSLRKSAPFVSTCCLVWEHKDAVAQFEACYQKAFGGTLFIKNINALPEQILIKLQRFWDREYIGQQIQVRIMCTLSPRHENGDLLESSAPWLSVCLPQLKQRIEDIPALFWMLKEKYKNIQELSIDNECWPLLLSFPWQDNVKGVERFYAKLAVLSEQKQVSRTLLLQLFPEFESVAIKQQYLAVNLLDESGPKLGTRRSLASTLLEKQIPECALQHVAVSRSLEFIMQQFSEKITIEHAAQKACVSSPHLSYLFRKHLGVSFKKLLLELRIEQSKKLLATEPDMQITQISHETGFHDLSHFEKTFRKLVGVKPSQYRRQIH